MRRSVQILVCIIIGVLTCYAASPADANISRKAVEALQRQFGGSVSIVERRVRLSSEELHAISVRARSSWPTDSVTVLLCERADSLVGLAIIDEVRGKVQPISYLVTVAPDGSIRDVDILAYREAYGGGITHESFRRQFRGMKPDDDITPGKSISSISGATISVRAITFGIRRVLMTVGLILERVKS